jgi:hypothetical protein
MREKDVTSDISMWIGRRSAVKRVNCDQRRGLRRPERAGDGGGDMNRQWSRGAFRVRFDVCEREGRPAMLICRRLALSRVGFPGDLSSAC